MAKVADHFRAADVTAWGTIALGVWAVAILGANLSGLIPSGVYAALHASRLEATSLNELRAQVNALEADTVKLRGDAMQLTQRFNMGEEAAGSVTKRVGALEVSLPKLMEQARARPAAVDPMATGSIGNDATLTFNADGGTVAVRQRPLAPSAEPALQAVPVANAMPAPIAASRPSVGIALGTPVTPDLADARWQEIVSQVGTMLVGLSPVLAPGDTSTDKLLVAGPLLDRASAIELCDRMATSGIPCEPVSYAGDPMPLMN